MKINWSEVVDNSVGIIGSFLERGVTPTLRTVYYALVSKAIIPNTMSAYKRLSSVMVEARKEGKVRWGWIADETRETRGSDNPFWEPEDYAKAYVDYVIDAYKRYAYPASWLKPEKKEKSVGAGLQTKLGKQEAVIIPYGNLKTTLRLTLTM